MNSYEAKRAQRIERLHAKSEKKQVEGEARLEQARSLSRSIPFGQPILVGHHSEKRHRRDLQRIRDGYDKGFGALNESQKLKRRALNAEHNPAISADDPDALTKLRAKRESLAQERDSMKAINQILRKGRGDLEKTRKLLQEAGYNPEAAAELLTPDFAGRTGFPAYKLSNTGAEIRRLDSRIKILEAEAQRAAALAEEPEGGDQTFGDITLREEDGRVQLVFQGKPSEDIRRELKKNGFRWSPRNGAWQRQNTLFGRQDAERLAKKFGGAA